MKRAVVTMVMLVSVTAFAGKQEREYMKEKVMPAVKEAEAKFKAACGCALKITVKEESYKEVGEMSPARSFAESVTAGSQEHCTDAPSKKALCQMKTLEIAWAEDVVFTFKDGKALATTNGTSRPSWEMVVAELDK